MPLVFSSSNAKIFIDKSQTSHIGNAIGFLIFKCSNFYWQITNITHWQCHWFSHLQMLKFLLTNHTRHLLAMPLVFSSSNAQILIDKSQTSHKTFIGNAIGFLIFKCSNFNWQITNITQDILQCLWFINQNF
jgi:hypothetical protein